MAARKSCTHLTWAEAKAKIGGSATNNKKKSIPKKVSHDQALTAKILSKNGLSQDEVNKERRRARKEQERFAAASAKKAEERLRSQQQQVVKPYEQAIERISQLALQHASSSSTNMIKDNDTKTDPQDSDKVLECKQMQLDEIMALEAIFCDDTAVNQILLASNCNIEGLREKMELLEESSDADELQKSIIENIPLNYYMKLEFEKEENDNLSAHLLLRVTYPSLYPLDEDTAPIFEVLYFIATDKTTVCSIDKPLDENSLATISDVDAFQSAIVEEAKQLLPDPCIYELIESWLTSNIWNFVKLK